MVVIGSIIIGIWALLFLLGFFQGQADNYIGNIIENETSHIQFHDSIFKNDFETKLYIPSAEQIKKDLYQDSIIKAVGSRILLNGMIASPNASQGIMAKGIDPDEEQRITQFSDKILEGLPLDSTKKNPIIISQRLAEKLKVKLRSKVVLTFQDVSGEIVSAAFKVHGLYKTYNKNNDELYVFAHQKDLARLAGIPEKGAHELALVLNDFDGTEAYAIKLKERYPEWKVETYKEISPDLDLFNSQMKINTMIMTSIFMLALIFGIINTMLMAVLERMKELGMLMAVGMNKGKVFLMVVLETILISTIGAPFGMVLGYITISMLNKVGIDLSTWSNALEEYGMSSIIRPTLDNYAYWFVAFAVIITAVLAAIYPAIKAIKLKPVDALRKI
jgi:ABC-type lipoprotein release transport system permease subunit